MLSILSSMSNGFAFQALEMIHNIREAFNEILKESDWMDEETKAVAKEKVNITHQIHFNIIRPIRLYEQLPEALQGRYPSLSPTYPKYKKLE